MRSDTFRIVDSDLHVTCAPGGRGVVASETRKLFHRLMGTLRRAGFTIGLDPEIEERFKSLSKEHRYGRHGDLELQAHYSPAGMEIRFFQNLVRENRHGGQHDFDRRQKMPYPVLLRWRHAINQLKSVLTRVGFQESVLVNSPIPDPLAYFNGKWDSEFDRLNSGHRFSRGDDGWPIEKELGYWPPIDANGIQITQGCVRFFRTVNGHQMRGRCYGGINGRWTVVYGPGRGDFTHLSSHELHSMAGERKLVSATRREKRMRDELRRAVGAENFERAIVLRNLITAQFGETLKQAA